MPVQFGMQAYLPVNVTYKNKPKNEHSRLSTRIYHYIESLESAHLELLRVRQEKLSKQFFRSMCKPDSKLNCWLEKRIPSTHNTRNSLTYLCPIPKHKCYKGSFVINNLLELMQRYLL